MGDSKIDDIMNDPAYTQFYECLPDGDNRVAPFTIYSVKRVFVRRKVTASGQRGQWRRRQDDEVCDVVDYDFEERHQMVFSVMHPANASKNYWTSVRRSEHPRHVLEALLRKYDTWLEKQ